MNPEWIVSCQGTVLVSYPLSSCAHVPLDLVLSPQNRASQVALQKVHSGHLSSSMQQPQQSTSPVNLLFIQQLSPLDSLPPHVMSLSVFLNQIFQKQIALVIHARQIFPPHSIAIMSQNTTPTSTHTNIYISEVNDQFNVIDGIKKRTSNQVAWIELVTVDLHQMLYFGHARYTVLSLSYFSSLVQHLRTKSYPMPQPHKLRATII